MIHLGRGLKRENDSIIVHARILLQLTNSKYLGSFTAKQERIKRE